MRAIEKQFVRIGFLKLARVGLLLELHNPCTRLGGMLVRGYGFRMTICRATPYCRANVAQLWSSLSKAGVSHLCGGTLFVCPVPRGIGLSQIPGSIPVFVFAHQKYPPKVQKEQDMGGETYHTIWGEGGCENALLSALSQTHFWREKV